MVRCSIVTVVVFCALTLCQAAEPEIRIAKVDMRELESLLLEVAFARPEYHEIRDRYAVSQEREQAFREGGWEAAKESSGFALDMLELKPIVEGLAKAELILLIEDMFGDRYQLVIDDSYGDGVLYTEIAIPDITPNIYQRLLKDRLKAQEEKPVPDEPVGDID